MRNMERMRIHNTVSGDDFESHSLKHQAILDPWQGDDEFPVKDIRAGKF